MDISKVNLLESVLGVLHKSILNKQHYMLTNFVEKTTYAKSLYSNDIKNNITIVVSK